MFANASMHIDVALQEGLISRGSIFGDHGGAFYTLFVLWGTLIMDRMDF